MKDMEKQNRVLGDVFTELNAAEKKHPDWPANIFEQLTIIGEEFGEVQKAALQAKHEGGDPQRIYGEGVHLAAMGLRFLLNFEIESEGPLSICGICEKQIDTDSEGILCCICGKLLCMDCQSGHCDGNQESEGGG